MTIRDLGMTERQAVDEILIMRRWDAFLQSQLGGKKYGELSMAFARTEAAREMESAGIEKSEIKTVLDAVDKSFE